MTAAPLTRARVLALAWPVVLAQAATAMTGVVDTAVMGRFGDKTDLAAVAVAAVSFSFIYWAFGFLRMSTTGLTAQAEGGGDKAGSRAILQRSLLLAGALGVALILLFPLIRWAALAAFQAEADVETLATGYFNARIWGAPAALMGFAVNGWLLGTGRTRGLLAFQIVLNGVNAGLDAWFVAGLGWGPAGIGAGTAIAEWTALGFGLFLVRDGLKPAGGLFARAKLAALFTANRDIMIRTLALLFAFAWFVNSGAQVGTAALAGNQVLLQFIAVAAFVLDAFAFTAEKEIGEAYGARDPARLGLAMRRTSELAVGFGALIALLFFVGGGWVIETVVADPEARAAALAFLPYCAVVPLIGVAAWQLDGAFLGATQGAALRNAGVASMALYVGADLLLAPRFGNTGVWAAFLLMYVFRAACLGAYWPRLMRAVSADPRPQPQPQS
ncbi:MAG: MATE family efflux transporter [Pseudomonadota bacterium]